VVPHLFDLPMTSIVPERLLSRLAYVRNGHRVAVQLGPVKLMNILVTPMQFGGQHSKIPQKKRDSDESLGVSGLQLVGQSAIFPLQVV